ncbi:MAG TPA: flagellar motor protein MotB [Vulgatibacter sp.]|nr:flagellar motor protein MotB [Vulgatibacter sp.]
MSSKGRKSREVHEEHENHERWLVSYADFITLLFAFFVVMYAVSQVDKARLENAAKSIRIALRVPQELLDESKVLAAPVSKCEGPDCEVYLGMQDPPELNALRQQLEKSLRPFLEEANPQVTLLSEDGMRVVIRIAATKFFDSGGAALHPMALPVLDAVGAQLRRMRHKVRIEGHTDDRPIRSARYPDNWSLSAARAATVVSYMERAHNISADRLAAVGMSSIRPVGDNQTEEGREVNRRIEVVIETTPSDILSEAATRD